MALNVVIIFIYVTICMSYVTSVTGPYSFSIGDTSAFSEYERGGVVTEVKQPSMLKFVSINILLIC